MLLPFVSQLKAHPFESDQTRHHIRCRNANMSRIGKTINTFSFFKWSSWNQINKYKVLAQDRRYKLGCGEARYEEQQFNYDCYDSSIGARKVPCFPSDCAKEKLRIRIEKRALKREVISPQAWLPKLDLLRTVDTTLLSMKKKKVEFQKLCE
ncbi:hypothetical protein BHM03_00044301 [Ensete ventricosum]|nr:hypothetical protein BHM03_00044301 [Ensete ventricosum]